MTTLEKILILLNLLFLVFHILEWLSYRGFPKIMWIPFLRAKFGLRVVGTGRTYSEVEVENERLRKEIALIRRAFNFWAQPPTDESVVPGCIAEKGNPPSFQFSVRSTSPLDPLGDEIHVGYGLCVNFSIQKSVSRFFFIMPMHVHTLCNFEFKLTGPLGEQYYSKNQFRNLEGQDVMYKEVSSLEMVKLGVSAARPQALSEGSPAYVAAKGFRYAGFCEDEKVLGVVSFTGTTKPGFSGAAYFSTEKTAFAMHTTGSGTKDGKNCGVNLLFIRTLLRLGKQESSEEYYESAIVSQYKKNELVWGYAYPGEFDYVVFKDQKGNYHEIENDLFDNIVHRHGIQSKRFYQPEGRLEGQPIKIFKENETQTVSVRCGDDWIPRTSVGRETVQTVRWEAIDCEPVLEAADMQPVSKLDFEAQVELGYETLRYARSEEDVIAKAEAMVKENSSFLGLADASVDSTTLLPESGVPCLSQLVDPLPTFPEFRAPESSDTLGPTKTLVQLSEASTCKWVEQRLSTLQGSLEDKMEARFKALEDLILQRFSHALAPSATPKLSQKPPDSAKALADKQKKERREELQRKLDEQSKLLKQKKKALQEEESRKRKELEEEERKRKELIKALNDLGPQPKKKSSSSTVHSSKSSECGDSQ